jgi:large subunit ribosomal protein L15
MKTKKRTKSSRFRGSKTHARGFKKKARGSGHQGGVGMAGTGKRGDQKKTLILNLYGSDYFGKDKTLRRGKVKPKLKSINLQYIQDNLDSMVKEGIAKEKNNSYEIVLKGYKVLAEGDLGIKINLTSNSVSESAKEKIENAGGSVTIIEKPKRKSKK